MKSSEKSYKGLIILAWVVFSILIAAYYSISYQSHFFWQEQNQIFLHTADWISGYFDSPAWFCCLAGDWLTQLYIYPIVGPVILTLMIALCAALFAIGMLRLITPKFLAWILILMFAVLMLGFSFPSSTTLSFFICLAGGLALGLPRLRLTIRNNHKSDLSPLLVPLSYWLFGFGALVTAFLVALFSLKERRWPFALCAMIFAFAMPATLRNSYALPYSKAILYPGVARISLPETKFERRLAIADAFYKKDYDKVRSLANEVSDPDDFTAFYYYLSSAVKDSLPDNLLKYPVKSLGTLTTIGERTPLPVINMMNDLYFELGDMTYAERAAMMRNVFSPRNRNVRMMQRLAEINLVSSDTLAALKYLRILDNTFAYAGWSNRHSPGKMSPGIQSEILHRRKMSNDRDNIRLGDNCRNIILELLESNPYNTVALDYLLCTDLLLKDMDTFKMDYDAYCMEKGSPRYKDLYQQALMIYLAGTDASPEDWEKYIVSGNQLQLFNQYSNRRGDPAFADTYWYYFDSNEK